MTDDQSLLGFIARRYTSRLEDAATDALYFILSRSETALATLADFLGDGQAPLPIAGTRSQWANTFGAVPDLTCTNTSGGVVALIESKFWAPLTKNQPVTYWEELPADQLSALLFLAPDDRINPGSLWDELLEPLESAGHELGASDVKHNLITATGKDGHRRLVLASWSLLLDRVAEQVSAAGDQRALFEIDELKGLAATAIAGDNLQHDENFKVLVAKIVKRVEQSGWADTKDLAVGGGRRFPLEIPAIGRGTRVAGDGQKDRGPNSGHTFVVVILPPNQALRFRCRVGRSPKQAGRDKFPAPRMETHRDLHTH